MKVGLLSPPHQATGGGGYTYVNMIYDALKEFDLGQQLVFLDFQSIEYTPGTEIPETEIIENHLTGRVNGPFNRSLNYHIKKNEIDFLWMVTPSTTFVPCVPFMITVWDLAHRYYPFFPEVSTSGWTWSERENYYTTVLPRASYILTGTNRGAQEIMSCYGIPAERIRKNPLPAPQMGRHETAHESADAPFPSRSYLLYPAQFWPHKNHVRAIKALRLLREDPAHRLDLVLVGSDHGGEDHVRRLVEDEGMTDHVHFAGFVDRETLVQLYRNAEALLYLSVFGPDNLPPLEALGCECPVVVSDHPGHREQLGETAIFVDPLDEYAIADGVKRLRSDPDLRERLKLAGLALIHERSARSYVSKVRDILSEFELYRACWPMPSSAGANPDGRAADF
jgi:glycosyltransferase involved in cell wall biosynthesis